MVCSLTVCKLDSLRGVAVDPADRELHWPWDRQTDRHTHTHTHTDTHRLEHVYNILYLTKTHVQPLKAQYTVFQLRHHSRDSAHFDTRGWGGFTNEVSGVGGATACQSITHLSGQEVPDNRSTLNKIWSSDWSTSWILQVGWELRFLSNTSSKQTLHFLQQQLEATQNRMDVWTQTCSGCSGCSGSHRASVYLQPDCHMTVSH